MSTERIIEGPEARNSLIKELDFCFDGLKKQKVLSGAQAWARLLDRLLRKRKGTNPSDPNMGIGLDSYRFSDMDTLTNGSLVNTIRAQTSMYLPQIPISQINVSTIKYKGDWILFIHFSILASEEEINIAYAQRKRSIISTKVDIVKQKFINTKGS